MRASVQNCALSKTSNSRSVKESFKKKITKIGNDETD